jgi:hypothetical protein
MMSIVIYIFNTTHNILQLDHDYNYINLITYLHYVTKLHMLNVR